LWWGWGGGGGGWGGGTSEVDDPELVFGVSTNLKVSPTAYDRRFAHSHDAGVHNSRRSTPCCSRIVGSQVDEAEVFPRRWGWPIAKAVPRPLRSQEVLFSASPASVTGAPHENGREGVPVLRRREHHHFTHPSGVGASMSPRRRQSCSRTCALGSARTTHGSPAVASSCGRGLFTTHRHASPASSSQTASFLQPRTAPPGGPTIGCEPAPAGAAAPSTRAPPVTTAQPPLPTAANAEARHARDEGPKRRRAKGRPKRMNLRVVARLNLCTGRM